MPQKKKKSCYKLMLDLSVTVGLSFSATLWVKSVDFFFFPMSLPNTGGNALCVFPQKCTENALSLTEGLDHSQRPD